jgi:hypothetical protein
VSNAVRKAVEGVLLESERKELHQRVARPLLEHANSSDETRLLAGVHMLHAGEERVAARLFSQVKRGHTLGIAHIGTIRAPLLEVALEVLHKCGRTDEQCLGLLVPLALSGYFDNYALQVRHLPRAMAALSRLCGVTLATKLERFASPKLALYLGFGVALLRHLCTPREKRVTDFPHLVRDLLVLGATGTAAALCAMEIDQARGILATLAVVGRFGEGTVPARSATADCSRS